MFINKDFLSFFLKFYISAKYLLNKFESKVDILRKKYDLGVLISNIIDVLF